MQKLEKTDGLKVRIYSCSHFIFIFMFFFFWGYSILGWDEYLLKGFSKSAFPWAWFPDTVQLPSSKLLTSCQGVLAQLTEFSIYNPRHMSLNPLFPIKKLLASWLFCLHRITSRLLEIRLIFVWFNNVVIINKYFISFDIIDTLYSLNLSFFIIN